MDTMPASSRAAMLRLCFLELLKTDAPRPKGQSLASATASSSLAKGMTDITWRQERCMSAMCCERYKLQMDVTDVVDAVQLKGHGDVLLHHTAHSGCAIAINQCSTHHSRD